MAPTPDSSSPRSSSTPRTLRLRAPPGSAPRSRISPATTTSASSRIPIAHGTKPNAIRDCMCFVGGADADADARRSRREDLWRLDLEARRRRAAWQLQDAARPAHRAREDRQGRAVERGVSRPPAHGRDLLGRARACAAGPRLDIDADFVAVGHRNRQESTRARRYNAPLHLHPWRAGYRAPGESKLDRLRANGERGRSRAVRARA